MDVAGGQSEQRAGVRVEFERQVVGVVRQGLPIGSGERTLKADAVGAGLGETIKRNETEESSNDAGFHKIT